MLGVSRSFATMGVAGHRTSDAGRGAAPLSSSMVRGNCACEPLKNCITAATDTIHRHTLGLTCPVDYLSVMIAAGECVASLGATSQRFPSEVRTLFVSTPR